MQENHSGMGGECPRIFCYGTLREGLAPPEIAHVANRLVLLEPGRLPGRLFDFGEFPGALVDPACPDTIIGDVFAIPDDSLLTELDRYEEYDPAIPDEGLFVRRQYVVTLQDGRELLCWVYAYNRDPGDAPLIPGGDYKRWLTEREKRPQPPNAGVPG